MPQPHPNMDLSRARWYKSTRSNGGEGGCVEVADNLPGIVAVRDSKNPNGPSLVLTPTAWSGFLNAVKQGRFEL